MSASGCVRKRDGKWLFVLELPSPDGNRRQVYRRGFPTKKAAQEALDKTKQLWASGLLVEASTLTVGVYLNDHWLPAATGRIRPTTADAYRRVIRLHLVPKLGSVKLQQLDRAQVSRWVSGLSAEGLAPKYVRNIHGVLVKALEDAIELGLIARNVASRLKTLPSVERGQPRAWTTPQLRRFLDAIEGERLAPLWRFIALTGSRRGEALGLRWSDVDLDAGTATIVHQRTIAGGSVVEGAPKTRAGARTVALDPRTVAMLRAWRRQQSVERLRMGGIWPDHDLVFTHPDGVGLWPQMVTDRFRTLARELGLPTIGVHGLRHTAATWMIAEGVNPKVVSQRLGHAHVSVTLGIYSHVLPAHDREAADAMARALDVSL